LSKFGLLLNVQGFGMVLTIKNKNVGMRN